MKESGRLTARDTTELEHRLLEAARKARMPDEMTSRMRQGLGFGAKAAGAGAAAVSLKVGGTVLLATVAIIGAAGTINGWFGHGVGAGEVVVTAPAIEPTAAAPPATTPSRVAIPPPVSKVDRPPRGPAARRTDGVREELAMLEQARSALAAGAADRALDLLARHDRRYPHGSFLPEAVVLRVEALAKRGDTDKARALATRFLAKHPDSPLAERVEHIISSGR